MWLCACVTIVCAFAFAQAYVDPLLSRTLPWDPVPSHVLQASPKKVFAHYFSPFPISIDNKPAAIDYYTTQYLNPYGEGGKHAGYGGFLRCRPPPRPPVNATDWQFQDMMVEVQRAIQIGLDGFFFDILTTDQNNVLAQRFDLLLDAAQSVDPNFVLGFMPDMTAQLKTSPQNMVPYILQYANRTNIFRYLNKIVISPFDAVTQTPAWWASQLNALDPAAFVPLFLSIGSPLLPYVNISVGAASWGGQDIGYVHNVITEGNYVHKQNLDIWMAPNTGQDFRPKSGWYLESRNSYAFRGTWESIIQNVSTQWVQHVTWNDYSETTQLSPNSCSGTSFADLANYYVIWFKTGSPPTIVRDAIYYFHRIHSSSAVPSAGSPQNVTFYCRNPPAYDEVEMVAFLTQPSILRIELSNGSIASTNVSAGLQSFIVPLTQGPPPRFSIIRDGITVLSLVSAYAVSDHIIVQDFSVKSGSIVGNQTAASMTSSSTTNAASLLHCFICWLWQK